MAKLAALKIAMEDEMNSVTNALRNTFINRIPTTEEIASTCRCSMAPPHHTSPLAQAVGREAGCGCSC